MYKGIDDLLAAGETPTELTGEEMLREVDSIVLEAKAVDDARRAAEAAPSGNEDRLQIIIADRFLRDITRDSIAALMRINQPAPRLFRRGSVVVRLGQSGEIVPLDPYGLRGELERAADYVVYRGSGSTRHLAPARPPLDVVNDIRSLPDLPLPELVDVRASPVFLPGGRLLSQPGYDEGSGIYLQLGSLSEPLPVFESDKALCWLLDELLGDFPFVDDASRAHALALIMLPFVRPLIDGPTPLHLIDAPARGTGKGLLATVASLIPHGHPAMVMVASTGTELEKRITPLLVEATPSILLDNVTRLTSTELAAALTSTTWRGRFLGESRMVTVPNRTTWVATGNNVELSDEIRRRTVSVRMDARREDPEGRTGFRHPSLPTWVRANRYHLVGAVVSLIQVWVRAGMPRGRRSLGSFEAWSPVMGGILDAVGVPGFLGDRDRLRSEADSETIDWVAFCGAWWATFGDRCVTAGQLIHIAREKGLLLAIWAGRNDLSGAQRLGHELRNRRDRVFGAHVIRTAGNGSGTGNTAYRLEARQTPETPKSPSAVPGELPEVHRVKVRL
jgi:putative DNA primase/helicase